MKSVVTLTLLLNAALAGGVGSARASTTFDEADLEGVLLPRVASWQTRVPIGSRVRITSASTLELPGLARLDGQTITGRMVSRDADTVTIAGATDQPHVTVPRPNRRIVGVLKEVTAETVILTLENGSTLTIPRSGLARVERPIGRRSRKRNGGIGFLVGGGGGAAVGYLIGSTCHSDAFLGCFMEPLGSTLAGLIFGGVAGAGLGAAARPDERWEVAPPGWVDGLP